MAPDDVWAVGNHVAPSNEHADTWAWDGAAWRHEPLPTLRETNGLSDVDALPCRQVWAVGFVTGGHGPDEPVVLARCQA